MKGVKGGATLEEIERVYRTRLPGLRRLAAAVSGSREAAFDLVQEAFVRAVRDRGSFRHEAPIEAWLCRIVVNVARNHRRAERDHLRLPLEDGFYENGTRQDDASRVAAAVASLPERQRLALFLRYYVDLDYRAIAAALEISSGTVGATLHAARETLLSLLSETEAAR
jgi:RNA polymerase sigma-70 factor (ECF subfamily)